MERIILCHTASDRDNKSKSMKALREKLPPCPICGRTAYLEHDVADGADFGYSVGCRSFHNNGNDASYIRASFHGYDSKEEAFKAWIRFCERMGKDND